MIKSISIIALTVTFGTAASAQTSLDDLLKPAEEIEQDRRIIDYGVIENQALYEKSILEYDENDIRRRSFCTDKPYIPGWAQRIPDDYSELNALPQSIFNRHRHQLITESGECTCDTFLPSWDKTFEDYQAFVTNLVNSGKPENLRKQVRQFNKETRNLMSETTQLCRPLKTGD